MPQPGEGRNLNDLKAIRASQLWIRTRICQALSQDGRVLLPFTSSPLCFTSDANACPMKINTPLTQTTRHCPARLLEAYTNPAITKDAAQLLLGHLAGHDPWHDKPSCNRQVTSSATTRQATTDSVSVLRGRVALQAGHCY